MIYKFIYPKKFDHQISPDIAFDLNQIIAITPIYICMTSPPSFEVRMQHQHVFKITCPDSSTTEFEIARQLLIEAWQKSQQLMPKF